MGRFLGVVLATGMIMAGAAWGEEPAVVTRTSAIRIWVDQIGYRTHSPKMAVVASDSAIPDDLQIELRDEKTGSVVWKLADNPKALVKFGGGKKDGESGDYISHLDFSSFVTPGRYYFAMTAPNSMRSYKFNIATNPYREAGLAAWKGFYYNRADGEIPEKYGGQWTHGKAFLGPGQATEAKEYKWKVGNRWPDQVGTEAVDQKTYDVHGGWFDAGDLNKYTSNTVNVQNMLLMAYEMAKPGPKDKDVNIPESGNGIPDMLDEIRQATEFLIRDHDGTGAAFGRVHQESGKGPDTVKDAVQLTIPNSATTMARAAALAYAAVVWRESGLDAAFAAKCQEESLRSWNLLKTKPHPWPVDPKDAKKILSQGEMGGDNNDYAMWRNMAAAALFRLTGTKEYDDIAKEGFAKLDWNKGETSTEPCLWVYMHAKGADPAMVEKIKKNIISKADGVLDALAGRGYGVALDGYWWGSNQHVGFKGGLLVAAALLTDDAAKKKAYIDGAEQYVHYLYGRNALGTCFFSNMKSFGAEKSATVMFHGWVGNANSPEGAKYIGEGAGKIGPFPGYVIGGPNGGAKKLVEDLDWRKNPWEFTEPDIMYQAQVVRCLDAFIWPLPETAAPKKAGPG
jgi:hypothetical protein